MRLTTDQIIGYIDGKLELLETAPVYDELTYVSGKEDAYRDVLDYIREHSDPV